MHSELNKSDFMHVQITAYAKFISLGLLQISNLNQKPCKRSIASKTDIIVNKKMMSDKDYVHLKYSLHPVFLKPNCWQKVGFLDFGDEKWRGVQAIM